MPQSSIAQWLKHGRSKPSNTSKPEPVYPVTTSVESTDTYKVAVDNKSEKAADESSFYQDSLQSSLHELPDNVTISYCTADHIKSFRRLNALLLPIQYPDYFYKETIEDEVIASVTRIALWRPSEPSCNRNCNGGSLSGNTNEDVKVVAGIRCRVLQCPPHQPGTDEPVLYISTIGTLAPFRDLSLASHLLEEILRIAQEYYGLDAVYAHVWEVNEEAMKWYRKRGFTILRREDGYYKRLAPRSAAWLIRRDIRLSETLRKKRRHSESKTAYDAT